MSKSDKDSIIEMDVNTYTQLAQLQEKQTMGFLISIQKEREHTSRLVNRNRRKPSHN